jgi:hypothetical protein
VEISVIDTIPPVPDVAELIELKDECSVSITESPTATDACTDTITGTTSDPLEYTEPGTYNVTWTFTDNSGNESTQVQTVIVALGDACLPNETICSYLGNDPKPSILDQDIFIFYGEMGENVAVTLLPDESGFYTGERATVILKDKIQNAWLFRIDRSSLRNRVSATLPATGEYRIIVSEQSKLARGKEFTGDYCLTLESSQDAWRTLEAAYWVK